MAESILVVLANKQDMEGCMSMAEVHQALGLDALKNRTVQVIDLFVFFLFVVLMNFFYRFSKHLLPKAKDWTELWIFFRMRYKHVNNIDNYHESI